MGEDKGKKVKKRIKIRKKIDKKKLRLVEKWKEAGHNIFVAFMIVFSIAAFYLLFYELIIEPNIPRHFYGPGDLKESILLLVSLLIVSLSYLGIIIIKYKPLNLGWLNDIRLFISVKFDLDKFSALKRLGIKYHHRKKKTKKRRSHHAHKSITEA